MVKIRVKMLFFDDQAVLREVDAAKRKVYAKAGAFIRRTAKTSIRKRKKVSEPGKPPSSHTGSLKRLVFFAYDRMAQTVVIGPLPFKRGTAPRVLELGGRTTVRSLWAGLLPRGFADTRRVVYVRKRPFMGPAMAKELPNFPDLWRGQVGRGRS